MKSPPLKRQKENTIRTAGEPTENVAISVIIWRNLAESVCLPCFGIARIANSLSERLVGWWWGGIRARGRRSLGDEQIRFARLRLLSNLLTGKHTHDQSHARQLNSCSEFVWVFARRSNLAAVWKKKFSRFCSSAICRKSAREIDQRRSSLELVRKLEQLWNSNTFQ